MPTCRDLSYLPITAASYVEAPPPPSPTGTTTEVDVVVGGVRRIGGVMDALRLVGGAPGSGMRRVSETTAGALGGAVVAGAAGGATAFCGGLPLFAAHPALSARWGQVTAGAGLVAAVPGAAMGAAWVRRHAPYPGVEAACATLAAAAGALCGWAWGRAVCASLTGWMAPEGADDLREALAALAEMVGASAGIYLGRHLARGAADLSTLAAPP